MVRQEIREDLLLERRRRSRENKKCNEEGAQLDQAERELEKGLKKDRTALGDEKIASRWPDNHFRAEFKNDPKRDIIIIIGRK